MSVRISAKLKQAVKLSPLKQYQLAHRANVHPATMSHLLNEIHYPQSNDKRVIRLGEVLGLSPEECFETNSTGLEG